jgi:hypothetical protein
MNSVLNNIKDDAAKTYTTNGDVTYTTTYNKNLDFFAGLSHYRACPKAAVADFQKAFFENKNLALKNLFYMRDIRNGQGIRQAFRECLNWLAKEYPSYTKQIIPFVIEYGRWDDILGLIYCDEVKDFVVNFVESQWLSDKIEIDILNSKNISLLAKWMPKINSKNYETRKLAYKWANALYLTPKEYRKSLKLLRRERLNLVETNLAEKTYDKINYQEVPGRASTKYRNAFIRNDGDRYSKYVKSLSENKEAKKKLENKVKTLYPYEIVSMCYDNDGLNADLAQSYWEALPREEMNGNCLTVFDSSASMRAHIPNTYIELMDVAKSLAIYTSEQASGVFKNKIITFSRTPKFIELNDEMSLKEKAYTLDSYYIAENTDITALYDLVFEASLKAESSKDYLDKLIIVTDCEFDGEQKGYCLQGVTFDQSSYDRIKRKFEKANIPMPTIVYWNLNCDRVIMPTTDIENVMLISGFSGNIVTELCKGNVLNAVDLMNSALERYSFVDAIVD